MGENGAAGARLHQVEGLIARSLGAELVVYDPATFRTHALAGAAAKVFERCAQPVELRALERECGSGRDGSELVRVAVRELHDAGLVVAHDGGARLDRRTLMVRIGAGAAAAIAGPLVTSVLAPTVAAAQSGGSGSGGPGSGGGATNQAPLAQAQSVETPAGSPRAITLTASDADSDPLVFTVTSPPSHGTLSGAAPNLTYTPVSGFEGTDSFEFRAADAHSSSTAMVTIAVTHVNVAPTAIAQSVTTPSSTALAITLSATDPELSGLTYTVVTPPSHGTLTGTAPNVVYTPTPGFKGSDGFTFRANDGTADSNVAAVSVSVTNRAPVANFTSQQLANVVPIPFSFDGRSSSDGDGTIVAYSWNFGDGSALASGSTIGHSYSVGGVYDVTLTVTDDNGATSSITKQVTVHATFTRTTVGSGTFTVPNGITSVSFVVSGAGGGGGGFGGGNGGNGARVSGTLSVTGGQVVSLFVGTGGGASSGARGGGGGSSSLTAGSTVVVAGGGGGGGAGTLVGGKGGAGGSGGSTLGAGANGSAGTLGALGNNGGGGRGGSNGTGGLGGGGGLSGASGSAGSNGNGGNGGNTNGGAGNPGGGNGGAGSAGGGGGGGGYGGGGGGGTNSTGGGGGGGGSVGPSGATFSTSGGAGGIGSTGTPGAGSNGSISISY